MDPYWQNAEPLRIKFNPVGPVIGIPEVKWDFVDVSEDKHRGSMIGVRLSNISVPTYLVSRHSNWGFIVQVHKVLQQKNKAWLYLNFCRLAE